MNIERITTYNATITQKEVEKICECMNVLESITKQMEISNCERFKNEQNDIIYHITDIEDVEFFLNSLLHIEEIF